MPIDKEHIRITAHVIHEANTARVEAMLQEDGDLRRLHTVIDAGTAELYKRLLPRYAELCDIGSRRRLSPRERAEMAITYGSLYYNFGDDGTVRLGAMWLATKPIRQARGS